MEKLIEPHDIVEAAMDTDDSSPKKGNKLSKLGKGNISE